MKASPSSKVLFRGSQSQSSGRREEEQADNAETIPRTGVRTLGIGTDLGNMVAADTGDLHHSLTLPKCILGLCLRSGLSCRQGKSLGSGSAEPLCTVLQPCCDSVT